MEKFAERLKELRLENELSQTQLSKETGISHTALVYWETGQRVPNAISIITLARYFRVTTDYLLGEANDCKTINKV